MTTGVVLAGGASTHQVIPPALRAVGWSRLVVAADSGLDLAERLDIEVDVVVGDLDSVSASALQRAQARGTRIESFPTDKDQTDLELAIDTVVEMGATSLIVLGGAGGRFDHLLANVAVIAQSAQRHDLDSVEAWLGTDYVSVQSGTWTAQLDEGVTLSVLAWSGDAVVSERGVRWPLEQHRISSGSALGVSNEALGGEVVITVHEGTALVIIPEAEVLQ